MTSAFIIIAGTKDLVAIVHRLAQKLPKPGSDWKTNGVIIGDNVNVLESHLAAIPADRPAVILLLPDLLPHLASYLFDKFSAGPQERAGVTPRLCVATWIGHSADAAVLTCLNAITFDFKENLEIGHVQDWIQAVLRGEEKNFKVRSARISQIPDQLRRIFDDGEFESDESDIQPPSTARGQELQGARPSSSGAEQQPDAAQDTATGLLDELLTMLPVKATKSSPSPANESGQSILVTNPLGKGGRGGGAPYLLFEQPIVLGPKKYELLRFLIEEREVWQSMSEIRARLKITSESKCRRLWSEIFTQLQTLEYPANCCLQVNKDSWLIRFQDSRKAPGSVMGVGFPGTNTGLEASNEPVTPPAPTKPPGRANVYVRGKSTYLPPRGLQCLRFILQWPKGTPLSKVQVANNFGWDINEVNKYVNEINKRLSKVLFIKKVISFDSKQLGYRLRLPRDLTITLAED